MTAGIIEDTELEIVAGELLPAVTLTDSLFVPNGLDKILAHIKAEVSKHTPDISTERGRKEIASLARKVASSNRRIDDYGKDHVAGIKVQAVAIDAERKRSRDILDKLRDDTRKPLTDWEDAEKNRVQAHEDALLALAELGNVPFDASLEDLAKRIAATDNYALRSWEEFGVRFAVGFQATSLRLKKLWAETKQAQEDRVELLRLQEAEAKRVQIERDSRIQAEAAAKAKADAEAQAEREANAARIEADRKANAAAFEAKRLQDEAYSRTRKAEEATARAVREAEVAVDRERQRVANEKRIEAEAIAKREANKKHTTAINNEVLMSLMALGATQDVALAIVTALMNSSIPHVRIAY
jgi:hypothetical protein